MCRSIVLAVLILIALPVACTRQRSSDTVDPWTGWLGPKRDGWVSGFQPPSPWPETMKPAWRVEVGTGYASPLVAGSRVYQHARQGEDEVVWCLDLETGEETWRQSYETPFKVGGGGEFHGKGPKASPALADGRLFTMSIAGRLSAWNADSGDLIWHRDYASSFKKPHLFWGAAGSPLVDGDRVVVHFGTDGEGALIALDAATGKEVWRHGSDGPSYSSPISIEIGGSRQIVDWNERALTAVDSESGQSLWELPYAQTGTDQNMPTPTFHDGRVLLGAENRGIRSLEPRHENGDWSVNEVWFQKDVALDMSSAVMNGDLLFGFSHYGKGRLFCLDPKTGEVLWQGPGRVGDNVTFLSVPGYVVALVDNGQLEILAATGERFEQVASYRVSESPTWAPPVLVTGGGILVKDHDTLTLWSPTAL